MTSTQPFTTENLRPAPAEDNMEMAASPYAPYDDIDFELDDDIEHYMSNNSMIDKVLDTEVKDDPMRDSSINNDTGEDEIDLVMEADEDIGITEDKHEHISTDENLSHVVSTKNQITTTNANGNEDEELLRPGAVIEDEDFLFEEEDDTDHDPSDARNNTRTTADGSFARDQQHLDSQPQTDDSFPMTSGIDSNKSTTDIVDFAVEASITAESTANDSKETPNELITSRKGDKSATAIVESNHQVGTVNPHDEVVDKSVQADQQPDVVPDEPDLQEHDQPFNHSAGTQLHPITLRYQDQDMSLFPPLEEDDSATYFLADSSLAFEPVNKLLSACRDLLGESIGHDDEMVLDIPSLGLHICEDSKYANQLTLAQVIDTYMLLSQNENLSPIKPLYCELTHRVCLTTQMAYLANSAREGKTYSDIVSEHMDTPTLGDESVDYDDDVGSYRDAGEEADDDEESLESRTVNAVQNLNATLSTIGSQAAEEQAEQSHDVNADSTASETAVLPKPLDNDHAQHLSGIKSVMDVPDLASDHSDAESRSSHTLDGDQEENVELEASEFDPEETEFLENDEIDLGPEEDGFEDTTVIHAASATNTDQAKEPLAAEREMNSPNEKRSIQTEPVIEDLDDFDDSAYDPVSSGVLLATPSKGSNGKRKLVDDDDDFLDIDFSTPEPKRTRPS